MKSPLNLHEQSLRRIVPGPNVHPDLAVDEADRQRREQIMSEANAAYQKGGADSLQKILEEYENSPESGKGEGVATLVGVIRQIKQVTASSGRCFWPMALHGFYTLLRLVVCGCPIYLVVRANNTRNVAWAWVLGGMAVFNPILPLHLSAERLATRGLSRGSDPPRVRRQIQAFRSIQGLADCL